MPLSVAFMNISMPSVEVVPEIFVVSLMFTVTSEEMCTTVESEAVVVPIFTLNAERRLPVKPCTAFLIPPDHA